MRQSDSLQVKARFFEITEHLFDPVSASVKEQVHGTIRQIGYQTPGFFSASFPMNQQVNRIDKVSGQVTPPQPAALSSLLDETAEGLSTWLLREPQTGIGWLLHNIEPMPTIQLLQHANGPEFTVTDQENRSASRDQTVHISQQSQLLARTTTASDRHDPSPDDRDRSLAVTQTDDQQLMPVSNLGVIDDQTDLTHMSKLGYQSAFGNGIVPVSYPDSRVTQEAPQLPNRAQKLGSSWDLTRNSAQNHRLALVDPHQQPDEVAHLGNP